MPPRCSRASPGRPARATRRSCPTSPGSIAPCRRASARSRCSRRRPRRSAGRTSTRASTSRWRTTRRCASARARRGCACAAISRRRSAARSRARSLRRAWPRSPRDCADLGVFEVAISDTIGIAHPGQVPRVLDAVLARMPADRDRAALPRHARHRARQRARVAALRHRDVRCVRGRPRRMPVRAGRRRQPGDRRSDLHAGRAGDRDGSVAGRRERGVGVHRLEDRSPAAVALCAGGRASAGARLELASRYDV